MLVIREDPRVIDERAWVEEEEMEAVDKFKYLKVKISADGGMGKK